MGDGLSFPPVVSSSSGVSLATLHQALSARNALKIANCVLAVIGDSISAGYQTSGGGWPSRLLVGPSVTINTSLVASGTTQAQAYADAQGGTGYSSLYSTSKGTTFILQRVVNDLRAGTAGDALYNSVTKPFVALLNSFGGYVVVVTCLPWSGASAAQESARQLYNSLVRQNAAGADVVIDLAANPLIGDGANTADKTLFADGLHLTDLGQDYATVTYETGLHAMLANAQGNYFPLTLAPVKTALGALTLSPSTAAPAAAYTGAISGRTAGSTITATSSDGTALTVSGSTVTGTFATAGTPTITLTETLAGAAGSPKTSQAVLTVSASGGGTGSTTNALAQTNATYGAGKFSQGQNGGYASLPTSVVATDTSTRPFTVEFWYSTTDGGFDVIIGQGAGGNAGWYFSLDGGRVKTQGGAASDQTQFNDGQPHHIACVLSGNTSTFFVDGVQRASAASTYGASTVDLFRFMQGAYGAVGTVDELAVFSGARYTNTFTPPTSPYIGSEANLLALYHLDGDGLNYKH